MAGQEQCAKLADLASEADLSPTPPFPIIKQSLAELTLLVIDVALPLALDHRGRWNATSFGSLPGGFLAGIDPIIPRAAARQDNPPLPYMFTA
jgi:hypothetical protein